MNWFHPNNSIRDFLGFEPKIIYEEHNLSDYAIDDTLLFDNTFLQYDIAQGMIFKGKRSGILHNFTMDVDPGYEYIKNFRGETQWLMMESKYFISNVSFRLKY